MQRHRCNLHYNNNKSNGSPANITSYANHSWIFLKDRKFHNIGRKLYRSRYYPQNLRLLIWFSLPKKANKLNGQIPEEQKLALLFLLFFFNAEDKQEKMHIKKTLHTQTRHRILAWAGNWCVILSNKQHCDPRKEKPSPILISDPAWIQNYHRCKKLSER